MTEKFSNEDQALHAAVQALQQEALAEEVPRDLLARITAIGMVPGVEGSSTSMPIMPQRKRWHSPIRAVAAAVLFLAVAGLFGLGAFLDTGSTLAFADVARPLRDAHSLTFQMNVQSPDIPKLLLKLDVQVFIKEPSRFRFEGPLGLIGIGLLEQDQSKFLLLHPFTKTALLIVAKGNLQQLGNSDPMEWVNKLRALAQKSAQPAGKRQIGNVEVQGFLVKDDDDEYLVWADPKTRLPIMVEESSPGGERIAYSDFRFNPELDDALFSLEVPKGYKLHSLEIEDLPPEESLVQGLRSYAEISAGKFPARLQDASDLIDVVKNPKPKEQNKKDRDLKNSEIMPPLTFVFRSVFNVLRVNIFLDSLKGNYGYSPEGVKLGDADKILFWYQPVQATKARVLYADLHWADLATDQLPQKAQP
jgi:outer membrane lipoprotein-sorting protein